MSRVDLGFAEECEPWQVDSYLFPSKIGGKPAWLDLENLPTAEDLKCTICEKPTIFLCQIYAPYEEDLDNFHRTTFIFICRNAECSQNNSCDNLKVFRNSLRRGNNFYSFDPVDGKLQEFVKENWVKMCHVCGCLGSKRCGKCKKVAYCSREHQVVDWKDGHKTECGNNEASVRQSKILFPEFEIVIESEEILDKDKSKVSEEEELEKFKQLEAQGKTGTLKNISEDEIEQHVSIDEDKTFSKFKKQISTDPDQILRYDRGGAPLWISDSPKPENIPDCESCGGPRQFEFQIMPQLLTVLKEIDIDFGVILVYTCKSSCNLSAGYKTEFVFKQDISEINE